MTITTMMNLHRTVSLTALLFVTAASAVTMPPPLDKNSLPDTGGEWISLEEGLEFQGNPHITQQQHRGLNGGEWESSSSSSSYNANAYKSIFVDGFDKFYDEYSQAWRVLGWYIDCDDCPQDDNDGSSSSHNVFCRGPDANNPYLNEQYVYNNGNNNNNNDNDRRRRLEEEGYEDDVVVEDGDDGVADEAVASYSSSGARSQCTRVLLWAAYVDLNYDGNTNTEYQFFNRKTNSWDTSLCQGSSTRCAKMDCHLPDSNFELLGIYKDRRADVWMSQLFNKQGDCIWSDEEYSFMNFAGRNNGLTLPVGCTRSTAFVSELRGSSNGLPLYYDIKPGTYGRISVGVYVDSDCVSEYKGEVTPERMLVSEGKYVIPYDSTGNATSSLEKDLVTWNDAFDAFKICQPCKAYDITHATVSHGFQRNYNNKRFGSTGEKSSCSASAEPNFNQCKLFIRGGYSSPASYSEVEQAGVQGSIAGIQLNGIAYGRTNKQMNLAPIEMTLAWVVLIGSMVLFISAIFSFLRARVASNRALSTTLREPLVPSSGVAA